MPFLSHDDCVAFCADGDVFDLAINRFFYKFDILLRIERQVFKLSAIHGGLVPTVEIHDVRFCDIECFSAREFVDGLAVYVVTDAHGDFCHRVEYIEFCECNFVCALHHTAVFGRDHVKSADSSGSARCSTVFSARFSQFFRFVSEHFRRERTFAHASGICFHNADCVSDFMVGDTRADRAVRRDGVGTGGVRINAEIDVSECAELRFEHDVFAGFERFVEIMDEPVEQDAPDATPIEAVRGHIEFRDLTYGYEDGKPVLDRISLDIRPGETFALVGPSGGGKTTICHLIPHFYDYTDGGIYIDGRELHSITAESLRRNIGIVQQDIYLFNASIRDNILYGRLDATQAEVEEAARRANIHDYIMTLEQGYDTVIGERGVRLSGGQKQRLSIARVFLKNPPILILDEATSALDNTTEILIQQALDELCRGRTTIVVAHRLSTIKNADEIAVIADGRVQELGDHDALMKQNGLYRALYDLQFRVDSGCR